MSDDTDWCKSMLEKMSAAPVGQMDPVIAIRLKALTAQQNITSDQILAVIDDCVYGSLCSDFCITVMNIIWKEMCKIEGITIEVALASRDYSLRYNGE